jgi:hypothetical protein
MKNELLNELNIEIANKLGVEPLTITYQVSNKAKSKFGHCKYSKVKGYIINLSEWILNSEMERDTICHELCHAYDHAYFGVPTGPHGYVWKKLMSEVFGYQNVKAQGFHSKDSKDVKLIDLGSNQFKLLENGYERAYFKVNDDMVQIRDNHNKYFESEKKEEYYMGQFIKLYQVK